jgi:hypothetical protein
MEKRHRIKEAVIPLPSVLLLAGDEKHLLARPWLAITGKV